MDIKGIIFDVDGVITNTEGVHYLAFKKVLKKYGYELTKKDYKKYFSGKSIRGGLISLYKEVDLKHNINFEEFVVTFSKEKIDSTLDIFKTNIDFYQDTLSFIKKVKSGNIKINNIGIVTEKPIFAAATGQEQALTKEVMKNHNLNEIFNTILTAEDYTHSKPDPECYLLTLKEMGLNSNEVIGIEDSPSGIKALNNASIFSVGLTTTHSKKNLKEARLIVKSLQDLLEK